MIITRPLIRPVVVPIAPAGARANRGRRVRSPWWLAWAGLDKVLKLDSDQLTLDNDKLTLE